MPIHTIRLATPLTRSFRVEQVAGLFDLPLEEVEGRLAHELTVELPGLEEGWTIGAIVGPSGSGKTTLARAVYGDAQPAAGMNAQPAARMTALYDPPPWPADRPFIDCLGDAPIKHITRTLTAVGLGSVPTWLKPYRVLSTGERFRADLARALLSSERGTRSAERETVIQMTALAPRSEFPAPRLPPGLLVFDEFTSTLDRTIAQTTSAALARYLRNPQSEIRNPKFIALTCHTDILPWLAPDWTLDLSAKDNSSTKDEEPRTKQMGESIRPSYFVLRPSWSPARLQRHPLALAIRRVPQSLWPRFAPHHYLAGGLAASATCYAAFWDDELRIGDCGLRIREGSSIRNPKSEIRNSPHPIAFCAVVASLGWKKTKRITRLVTLPEFQGLGIASQLAETVAAREQSKGFRVTITASHPAILAHCSRSPRWKYLGTKKTGSTRQRLAGRAIRCSTGRAVASFEFVGP
jgi:GNAT superfamily N-acetyltransferase